jgi:hypothetical protein
MKRGMIIFVLLLCMINFTGASLNLKISGDINGYSSDVRLKTNTASTSGIDIYDMLVPAPPDNYSKFYSVVSSKELAIDSWNTNPRTVNLVYEISSAQTGSLDLSWSTSTLSSYTATLVDYGDDSSYTTSVGSADMKTASSYTATLNSQTKNYFQVVVDDYTAPPTPPGNPGGSTGGGGGAGGGVVAPQARAFEVSASNYQNTVALNNVKFDHVTITNTGNSDETFTFSVEQIDNIISFDKDNVVIPANSSQDIEFKVAAPKNIGVYTGKIIVTSGSTSKEILITINVNTEKSLFDVTLALQNKQNTIQVGDNLQAQFNLLQMGLKEKMDVTLNYEIKDFEGKTYLTESETVAVYDQGKINKEFDTSNLPEGDYVLGVEMIYPDGVAVASSQFSVKTKTGFSLGNSFMYLTVFAMILLVIGIAFAIHKYKKIGKHLSGRK